MGWFKTKEKKTEPQRAIESAERDCWSALEESLQYRKDEALNGWSVMAESKTTTALIIAIKELKERIEELEKERE